MRKINNVDAIVRCNCCGKAFSFNNGYMTEECVHIRHSFGYFSKKDTVVHDFNLCEECYDKIVSTFELPVSESEETELFKI